MKYFSFPCGCSFPIVAEREGQIPLLKFDVRECNYNCSEVWLMLSKGLTKGVFQLDSHLGRQWCKRFKPTTLTHMAALGAALRPGVLLTKDERGVSATENYARKKNGEEPIDLIHPVIDKILCDTYGQMLFQEQAQAIGREVAGFNLVEADELRKAVGGKDQAKLAKVGEKFLAGVEKSGVISKELGTFVWENIKKSGRYLFVRSHSYSYGVNGYWSCLFKAHFPLYFFTAYLKNSFNEQKPFEEINELVNEAKLFDIEVKTPSVLNLKRHFDTDGEKIYFGLVDIKGVGNTHFAKLKEAFKQGKPSTWFEFLAKHSITVGISTCDKLIKAGALDPVSTVSRNEMLYELSKFEVLSGTELVYVAEHWAEHTSLLTLMRSLAKPRKEGGGCTNKNRVAICLDIIKLLENPPQSLIDDPNWIVWNEKLLLGEAITCSKTDSCDTTASNCTCKEFLAGRGKSGRYKDYLTLAVTINEVREMTIKKGEKKGQKFARLIVQDNSASLTDVMVWPEKFAESNDLLFEGNTVYLIGSRNRKDTFEVESVSQI